MDVADGSAAEEAEAHLRRPITGGKVCLGFLARRLAFTYYQNLQRTSSVFLGLFASHFHSFAFSLSLFFFSSYQRDTFLFTVQVHLLVRHRYQPGKIHTRLPLSGMRYSV